MNQYHKINSVFKRDEKGRFTSEFSLPEFRYLQDNLWIATEKVDGTNIRVMWDGESVTYGGKTDNAQMPTFLYDKLRLIFEKPDMIEKFKNQFGVIPETGDPLQVCLYGEGYGARIQKGGGNYKEDGVDFVLFDVKIGDWWLERDNVEDIAIKLGIDIVPIIDMLTLTDAVKMVSTGFKSQWGNFTAEGLVLKPATELRTRRGDRIVTKLKYKDFN